jgi:hypothetical protein
MSPNEPQWYNRLAAGPFRQEPQPTAAQLQSIQKEVENVTKPRGFRITSVATVLMALSIFIFVGWFIPSMEKTNRTSDPGKNIPFTGKDFDKLLSSVYRDGVFVFDNLPWLVSKQEVMQQKLLDDRASELEDALKAESRYAFNDSPLNQTVIYRFSDDQLVSGEYLFLLSHQDQFIEFCKELKTHLSQSLPKPFGNDLNVLDRADEVPAGGLSVLWEGQDRSTLSVYLLTNAGQSGEMEYAVLIKSASPLPDRKSLSS